MTNYEWFTTLSIEQLAQWLNTIGHYENSPWETWFNEKYCSKCESEFIKREDSLSKLTFELLFGKEIECAYCEVHDECRFFPNRKNPNIQEIIEMWLKEEFNLCRKDICPTCVHSDVCEHYTRDCDSYMNLDNYVEVPSTGIGDLSDGYHTFNELYHHRAILFSIVCNMFPDKAWKSKLHDTGDMFEGMFIVGIETPEGPATYHYDVDPYWDIFKVKELENAPTWDGHTPQDAINRIARLTTEDDNISNWVFEGRPIHCKKCGYEPNYSLTKSNSAYCPGCGAKMI